MKKKKPKKIIYKNKKQVFEKVKNFLIPQFKKIKEIDKVLIWGSLINKSFGVYSKPYMHHTASDIDIIVFLKPGAEVPNDFKYLNVDKTWFKGYKPRNFRKFIYEGNLHKVDILLVKPEFNETWVRKRIKKIKGGFVKRIYKK